MLAITRDMVERRHSKIGERSKARANLSMRLLSALFNYATSEYENEQGDPLFMDNPIKRISHTQAWYRVDRRRSIIKTHELPAWFAAVLALADVGGKSAIVSDYLQLLILTGLRREEAATLKWSDIDLQAKNLTVRDPKNHEPHELPLSDYLFDLLSRRQAARTNEYVFPGAGKMGHLVAARDITRRVIEASGVPFMLHDLRRSFITVAESLDISGYALKRLLNHATRTDVTAGYIVADTERLRAPMQKIADFILRAAAVKPTAPVVAVKRDAR